MSDKNIRDLFQPGQKFVVDYSTEDVSAIAYQQIRELCERKLGKSPGTIVGSAWLDKDGTYPGTLPKRIRKWFYKWHKIDIGDELTRQIGDIARNGMVKSARYQFDFDTEIRWRAGDFGDDDSCFMLHSDKIKWLRFYKTYAMRFFDEKGNGIARCLIVFPDITADYTPKGKYPQMAILCNAYNKAMGLNLARMSAILGKYLDMEPQPIHCANLHPVHEAIFYTNSQNKNVSDSETAPFDYAFSYEDLGKLESVDLNWSGQHMVPCKECGKYTEEDNQYAICGECFKKLYFGCCYCGDIHKITELQVYEIDGVESEQYKFCKKCWKQGLKQCSLCENAYHKHFFRELKVDGVEKLVCRDHESKRCPDCYEYYAVGHPCNHKKKDSDPIETLKSRKNPFITTESSPAFYTVSTTQYEDGIRNMRERQRQMREPRQARRNINPIQWIIDTQNDPGAPMLDIQPIEEDNNE